MTADSSGVPFVVVRRGGEMESEHAISFAIAGAAGDVRDEHDGDRFLYLRSAAKPLIATAVVAGGAAEHFGLSDAEIAIVAGSHAGTPRHLAVVRGLLEKIGLDESALRCGARPVLDEATASEMCAHGELPTGIHNNCSGKHAGILALVRHRDLDVASYIAAGHPVEQEILSVSADLLGLPLPELTVGVDGCGIPAVGCTVREAALGFARMASAVDLPERLRDPLARVFSAMRSYPENVSGDGRFDTERKAFTSRSTWPGAGRCVQKYAMGIRARYRRL